MTGVSKHCKLKTYKKKKEIWLAQNYFKIDFISSITKITISIWSLPTAISTKSWTKHARGNTVVEFPAVPPQTKSSSAGSPSGPGWLSHWDGQHSLRLLGGNNSTHTTSEMLSYRPDQIRSRLVGERTKRPGPANQIWFPTQHHGARLQRQPLRGGSAEWKQAGDQPAGVGALRIRVFVCV